jgi:WD40 repeat protein
MYGLNNNATEIVDAAKERTMAAFVLAIVCDEYSTGQAECVRLSLHGNFCALLLSYELGENARDQAVDNHFPVHLRLWLCVCLSNMLKGNFAAQNEAYGAGVHSRLLIRLKDKDPNVRAAVCCALGSLVDPPSTQASRITSQQDFPEQSLSTQPQSQQQLNNPISGTASTGLMPQRLDNATHVLSLPGSLGGDIPVQLQQTFNPTGASNLHFRPHNMEPGQSLQFQQRLQMAPPAGAQFMGQPMQFRPPQGQPLQAQFALSGHTIKANSVGAEGLAGFLVTDNPVGGQLNAPQMLQQQPIEPKSVKPSVYGDKRRLELDLAVLESIVKATSDASVVVRYEATIALACGVRKYRDAFIAVAEERSASSSPKRPHVSRSPHICALERSYIERFQVAWERLRSLQHTDPFPPVSRAANQIVIFVHEHLLHFRMEMDEQQGLGDILDGIEEEPSTADLPGTPPVSTVRAPTTTAGKPRKNASLHPLRRVLSEGVTNVSMEQNALLNSSSSHSPADLGESSLLNYTLPESEFYEWKKCTFDTNFHPADEEDHDDLDPMSPIGASKAYQSRRNEAVVKEALETSVRYASLAPKPAKLKTQSIQMILEQEEEEVVDAAEEEATAKKRELELGENKILRNDGVNMTSIIKFHSFEDVVISCGGSSSVALWSTRDGRRLTTFDNGNPEGSRMTTSSWLNEETSGMFLVGCDDGTVRIWGDILESNGKPCEKRPSLVSGFLALPMMAGARGSGLICEWQPQNGTMLSGGNSKTIHCWDIDSEALVCHIDTEVDANATTLTTAWDFDQLGMGHGTSGYQGIGRDIFVAGFSDGSLKIFDLRCHRPASDLNDSAFQNRRPRQRFTGYKEHKSWVVATAFAGYSNRYELISGTVTGEIKAWDLRMSQSTRTIVAQRSTMTALTVHSKIPIVATGSHAQFIKLLTLDGDTLQVLRYHEKMANHRIGPVSCLAFHKYKTILAAGSTDTFIGLYTPKRHQSMK